MSPRLTFNPTVTMKSKVTILTVWPAIILAVVMSMSAAVSSATTLYLGQKELVQSLAQRHATGLSAWPDGTIGVQKTGSLYSFYGSNLGKNSVVVGNLDNPTQLDVTYNIAIGSMKDTFQYAAGGSVYRDPASGTLLMFYHAEKWADQYGQQFYASICMAKSTDLGSSWTDLGEIIRPDAPNGSRTTNCDIGAGSFVIVGNYFYVYFSDFPEVPPPGNPNFKTELAVARALVSDVVSAALSGNVVAWQKYNNGWGGADTAGLGGQSSALETGNPSCFWSTVAYNVYLRKYVLAAANWNAAADVDIEYADSDDGLTWSSRQTIDSAGGKLTYATPIGLGSDPGALGSQFYFYYVSSTVGGANTWTDACLARKRISLTGSVVRGSLTASASGVFGPMQGARDWYYQEGSGGTYSSMSWNSGLGCWQGTTSAAQIGATTQLPNTTDSVRQWRAPRAGTATISWRARKLDIAGGDGVNVKVFLNTTQLWNQDIAYNDAVGYSYSVQQSVAAQDKVYFVVNQKANSTNDLTELDPEIYFTPTDNSIASTGFSGTQGTNQWSYQMWNGSSYTDLTYDAGTSRWGVTGDANLLIFATSQNPGASADSVRKWTAPSTGMIAITGNIRKGNTGGGDGVNAKILHNTTQIYSQDVAYNDDVGYNVNLTRSVTAGDVIYFRLNRKGANNWFDNTLWDPVVTYYTPTDKYNAFRDYSSLQGLNNWFYQRWNGTTYTDLTYTTTGSKWYTPAENYIQVNSTGQHPGPTSDAVLKWVAPVAGSVSITGNVKKSDVTGGDGVVVAIVHNTTQIYNQSIAYNDNVGYNVNLTRTVAAGDALYFRVNRNSSTSYDGTAWTPIISYQ